jgi:hypothetical protein
VKWLGSPGAMPPTCVVWLAGRKRGRKPVTAPNAPSGRFFECVGCCAWVGRFNALVHLPRSSPVLDLDGVTASFNYCYEEDMATHCWVE